MKKHSLSAQLALLSFVAATPAHAEEPYILITNARIMTMASKGEIANGSILIRGGRIVETGEKVAAPANAETVNAERGVVTPGFMLMGNAAGAKEFAYTVNYDDSTTSGDLTAGFDIQYAINPESVYLPELRREGSTLALVTPNTAADSTKPFSYLGGLAAVISSGATPSVVQARVAMTLVMGTEGAAAAGGSRVAQVIQLRRLFDQIKTAGNSASVSIPGLSPEDIHALKQVVTGSMPLLISVKRKDDILQSLALARDYGLKIVLNGAEEGGLVADEIARAGVPVIAVASNDTPDGPDAWFQNMDNLGLLASAGVQVAIKLDDGGGIFNFPTSRYLAGIAVAHGLPKEKALAALTSAPAAIFGLSGDYGTIEKGKKADFVIWTGDPFEPSTGVRAVFVNGVKQSLVSRKSLLRDRYMLSDRATR